MTSITTKILCVLMFVLSPALFLSFYNPVFAQLLPAAQGARYGCCSASGPGSCTRTPSDWICVYSDANGGGSFSNSACLSFCPSIPSCATLSNSTYVDQSVPNGSPGNSTCGGLAGNPYRCCAPVTQTCAGQGGFCSRSGNSCNTSGYTIAADTYDCSTVCCIVSTCANQGGYCSKGFTCGSGFGVAGSSYECNNVCCLPNYYFPNCTSGESGCTSWSGGNLGQNQCGNVGQTRTCNYDQPQTCNPVPYTENRTVFQNNCNAGAGYACTNNVCTTSIFVHVYKDYNHDGVKNGNDSGMQGQSVSDNGNGSGNVFTTDATGSVTYTAKATGTYNIGVNVPSGYMLVGGSIGPGWQSKSVSLTNTSGNATVNFYLTPLYTLSGTVFSDTNKNQKDDNGESGISNMQITLTGKNPTTTNSSGNYAFSNLLSGTYTAAVNSSLPSGYQYTTPSSWAITLGDINGSPACNKSSSLDASCGIPNNGSISALNFGATNENPHYGSVCMDIRADNNGNGTISDPFPAPPATCGGQNGSQAIINNGTCSTGSGIVFSCNGTFDFGLGTSNTNGWSAGGTASQDSECYTGGGLDVIPTSYSYLKTTAQESNITPTNLDNTQNADPTTSCTTTDCILPANLPKGIYQVQGNLTLDASPYTFPAPADPSTTSQAYIILVNGDLTINGTISVPKGSVVVFSVSGNIYVDKGVGNVITDPTNPAVNTPDLEGVYSSDHSFYVQSYASGNAVCNADGSPLDKRLVVLGVVVTNASKAGGSLVNNRDLCEYDTSCSALEMGDGTNGNDGLMLNYLLNLIADGQFLNIKNFNWQELKP